MLANSSWPLDRPRLAELLGFDGLAVNGYDATQISPNDVGLEAAQIAGSVALRVGALMQDVHVQYHQTRPWLLLAPGRTYTSSAMPQKANPGVIQNTRGPGDRRRQLGAGGDAARPQRDAGNDRLQVHRDERRRAHLRARHADAARSADVLASLRVDRARALEELESDWTTSMELAETLQREQRIPFRVGHHFASEVVVYAREHDLRPKAFPYAEAVRIYAEAGKKYQIADTRLPLDEAAFRRTLSPESWSARGSASAARNRPRSAA